MRRANRWQWRGYLGGVLLLLLWGLFSLPVQAQGNSKNCRVNWRSMVRLELREQPLLEIIKKISELTCYNFIVSEKLPAKKISLISEKAVPVSDIYRVFLSILEVSDLSVVSVGGYRRIIPTRQAAQESIPLQQGRFRAAKEDRLMMYMLSVKHIDAFQLNNVLRQLHAAAGRTIVFQPSSVILIIDYANNIERLLRVAKELDVPEADIREQMYILQVDHGQAQEIVQRIQAIFTVRPLQPNAPKVPTQQQVDEDYRISKIIADERTNRIVVVCGQRAYLHLNALVKKLDLLIPDGGGIRLTRLRYAKAEEVAQTLSQLAQGRAPVAAGRRPPAAAAAGSTDLFQGEIRITPDKSTNSLVIVSNQRDFQSLMRVIQRLDVRRKQIFVEAVIMEVSLEKNSDLGMAFHGGLPLGNDPNNPSFALLGTRLSGLTSLILDPASLMGLALGLRGPTIPGTANLLGQGVGEIPSFGVILRAMQTNSDVDLISTPHILTTTNEEATIQVGQNVPFIAGTNFAGAGIGIGFPVQNIQRQDVALTLKIKPQVNAGERVKLEIDLELTEIAAQNRELGPTTTKRKVKTTVRVQDNQTVVIGGLMRDRTSEGVSKVPVLGDIPLIGNLFRVKNKSIEKRNLLIFMTPHIVLNSADFQKIFRQKMKERQEFLETFYAQKYKELQDRAEMRPTGALDQMLVDYDRRRREETKALQEKEQNQQLNQKRYLRPRHEEISIRRGKPKKEEKKPKK